MILISFLACGLAYFTAEILWRGFWDLWKGTYDEITAACSRTEHFYPKTLPSEQPTYLDQLWSARC